MWTSYVADAANAPRAFLRITSIQKLTNSVLQFVTNSSVPLTAFTEPVLRARPSTRFIFNDGIGVNSGAFFARGWRRGGRGGAGSTRAGRDEEQDIVWTTAFLERWWRLGGEMHEAGREYASFLRDQAGLQEAVLWHAHNARELGVAGYAGQCGRSDTVDVYDEYAGASGCTGRGAFIRRLTVPHLFGPVSHNMLPASCACLFCSVLAQEYGANGFRVG